MKETIKNLFRMLGVSVSRYTPSKNSVARRMELINRLGINLVMDVGANEGQYARSLRTLGYYGRILSFEPLTSAYKRLRLASLEAQPWEAVRLAISDANGTAQLNIAGNSFSSSLAGMLDRHREIAPESAYVGCETVEVRRLDGLFDSYARPNDRVFLKIDTQGYERNVIDGATGVLPRIALLQAEASLTPLYDGEMLLPELILHARQLGFMPVSLEDGCIDPGTCELVQVDVLFVNERHL